MSRFALSLSLASMLTLAVAPTAFAEGNRSLGVTVSPVGGFMLGSATQGAGRATALGYAGSLGWSFDSRDSNASFAGYFSASAVYTAATPLAVRVTPFPGARVRPYLGLGASVLISHPPDGAAAQFADTATPIRLGGEVCAGVGVSLTPVVFLTAEGRYDSYSYDGAPFSSDRVGVSSGFLGVGFSL